eukprot:NODE_969_length_2691_cov_0.184028.p2 type:complete len:140 gc:universal NODE_969_length_2691_cov_0.184028:842-1261(+)
MQLPIFSLSSNILQTIQNPYYLDYPNCNYQIANIPASEQELDYEDSLTYLKRKMGIPEYCVSLANYYYAVAYSSCPFEFDLMLACLIIAFKFHSDRMVKNDTVEALIGYNTYALNSMEQHVLQILDYRLFVPDYLLYSF